MSYEVQFQHEGAEYIVRGPDIDGVLRLIQGVQAAPSDVPEWVEWSGGSRPVAPDQHVLVCLRNGNSIGPQQAYSLSWFHNGFAGDIVRYCVCE